MLSFPPRGRRGDDPPLAARAAEPQRSRFARSDPLRRAHSRRNRRTYRPARPAQRGRLRRVYQSVRHRKKAQAAAFPLTIATKIRSSPAKARRRKGGVRELIPSLENGNLITPNLASLRLCGMNVRILKAKCDNRAHGESARQVGRR